MAHLSLLGLITVGAGGIKSCVNVMGAQQMHPDEHKELITNFFTYFFASINLGAIIGGIVTPILLQQINFTTSFVFILACFVLATVVFVFGDYMNRYVKAKPQGSAVLQICKVVVYSFARCSVEKNKESQEGKFKDDFIEDAKVFFHLLPLLALAFKMDRNTFGWTMPAALMRNVDPIAVVFGFSLALCLGALALLCALIVEYVIMAHPLFTVSIWWQVPQFVSIAAGEIFLISTSYEVAFTHAPPELKAVASAVNLCFMAIANSLSAAVFQAASPWLPNFDFEEPEESMVGSHYDYYYYFLIGLSLVGAICCLLMIPFYRRVYAAAIIRQKSGVPPVECR
ncbi:hypothetical protein FOZ60_002155 [Perkinsus olseni]|uniref:Peptide transporter ptr2 n=1 Tax=Perkinsus olseni TaxID=32597 RepID=A0A7J6NYR5_PEROL|nr:hypothetical protein FOZ60_002155 [Perkinsus olseni]